MEVVAEALSASPRDYVTGIVIGYVAAVVTSVALLLTLLKHGW